MRTYRGDISIKFILCFCLLMASAFVVPSAHATIPDGTYTGTVDGNYNGSFCPGGSAFAGYSGADATLTVSGSTVTLDIIKSGVVSISGSGTQSGGNINLNYSFVVDGSGLNSGIHTDMAITPVIVSGSDVMIDFTLLSDSAGCSSLDVD